MFKHFGGSKLQKLSATLVLSSLALFGLALLSACGGSSSSGGGGGNNHPAPTITLAANPAAITAGATSTLTAVATNADSVVISNNVDNTRFTLPGTGGTQTVSPTTTTTYTATATGAGGSATATATVTVTTGPPTVTITANPATINHGDTSVLTVTATNATSVVITDNLDSNRYTLPGTGGTQNVTPSNTATYTATATGPGGTATATATVTVNPGSLQSLKHVLFLLQENRSFDTYFGMLNPYRRTNHWNIGDDGNTYDVDGIDDKLSKFTNTNDENQVFGLFHFKSTCIDDETSAWLESYGDVSRYDFTLNRPILMDGFVHTAENYEKLGYGVGDHTNDLQGRRAMGYYDEGFLNYYYYMASQFAISDRWFSPVSSKSTPNRIATATGGTTQGLVHDPFRDDNLTQTLNITTIYEELDNAGVSWKIYYTLTASGCIANDDACQQKHSNYFPVTSFTSFGYSGKYLYENPNQLACVAPTIGSQQAVGDPTNAFCIDPTHIAPISTLTSDMNAGTLPSYSFIEAGYGVNDEHPGSGQSILNGQSQVASILNTFMASPSWKDSVFFLSYDEGGGPFDHVPPVPGHTNDNTDGNLGITSDISSIAVNPDAYGVCLLVSQSPHCDLLPADPGANPNDAPAIKGFAAQLGFRVPNIIVSPFARKHYVSHTPMDHTAVIKFVENRFIGPSAHLTARDAVQPDLLEFFDFNNDPWTTPPTPPPPATPQSLGFDPCTPKSMGP